MLTAARDKEKREQRFLAAIQGIDLDKSETEQQDRFEAVKRRVEAKKIGVSEEQLHLQGMGIDVETI